MSAKRTWKLLVLGMMFNALMGATLFAGDDDTPMRSGGRLNGVDVMVEALTPTDIHVGEDVEFEVTLRNTTDGWRRLWLWFTVKLEGQVHEKMLHDPYLNKESPFHGTIPPYGEVVLQFRARPLDEIQVGFYTLTVKIGPYVVPFDREWVSAMDSFNGYILPNETRTRPHSGGQDGRWVVEPIDAITRNTRSFPTHRAEPMPVTARIVENFPNPFNPSTSITFEVEPEDKNPAPVELSVYDIHGRMVRTLVNGRIMSGSHTVNWDGKDERGLPVDSGIYLFRLRSGADISLKKGILTR